MSKVETILLALYQLTAGYGRPEASLHDLIVKSWELDPLSLGMRGYEDKYPDSKSVEAAINGDMHRTSKRLCRFRRTRPLMYALTQRGLEDARALALKHGEIKLHTPLEATG